MALISDSSERNLNVVNSALNKINRILSYSVK